MFLPPTSSVSKSRKEMDRLPRSVVKVPIKENKGHIKLPPKRPRNPTKDLSHVCDWPAKFRDCGKSRGGAAPSTRINEERQCLSPPPALSLPSHCNHELDVKTWQIKKIPSVDVTAWLTRVAAAQS